MLPCWVLGSGPIRCGEFGVFLGHVASAWRVLTQLSKSPKWAQNRVKLRQYRVKKCWWWWWLGGRGKGFVGSVQSGKRAGSTS